MTKQEAYKSMEQGNKVTHWYFSDDEYLYIDNRGIMRDENNYDWSRKEPFKQSPWDERSGFAWETGWSIWKNKKLIER